MHGYGQSIELTHLKKTLIPKIINSILSGLQMVPPTGQVSRDP
jgi:hypothetical protein